MEKAERETVIRWSEADQKIQIFTASKPVAHKLGKIRDAVRTDTSRGGAGEWFGEFWEVPMGCVLLRPKPRKRVASQAQRDAFEKSRSHSRKTQKFAIVVPATADSTAELSGR